MTAALTSQIKTSNTTVEYIFRNVWGNPNPVTLEMESCHSLHKSGPFVWSSTGDEEIGGYIFGVPFILRQAVVAAGDGWDEPTVKIDLKNGGVVYIPESEKYALLMSAFVVAVGVVEWAE
jgi:hypothetical protein